MATPSWRTTSPHRSPGPKRTEYLLASTRSVLPEGLPTAPGGTSVATVVKVPIRCDVCNRRLGDLVNGIHVGQIILKLKCPRCGQSHLEVIRPAVSTT